MRYYLTTENGEKGPYEEQHIREWLRAGTMPRDAPVRAENETTSTPASSVFPDEGGSPFRGGGVGSPPLGASPVNIYAPPIQTSDDWAPVDQGSFGKGFVFGFFCGCIAMIVSYTSSSMGSETKRGVRTGFITGMVIGFVGRLIAALAK